MGCKGSRVRVPPPRPINQTGSGRFFCLRRSPACRPVRHANIALPAGPRRPLQALATPRSQPHGIQMRILVSNDDGYFAPGIAALAEALDKLGQVTVVAPERDRSGASNSLTLDRPL